MMKTFKAIVFVDLETTGTDVLTSRIVDIAMVKRLPDGTELQFEALIDPGVYISPEATDVHGISNDDVKGCPRFEVMAPSIREFIGDSDIAGFNVARFDLPILMEHFARCGVANIDPDSIEVIDMMRVYHARETRTLKDAVRFYCATEHQGAHRAMADVRASMKVLEGQIAMYADLGNSPAQISSSLKSLSDHVDLSGMFIRTRFGEVVYGFGKHKGAPVRAHRDYLDWMLREGKFPTHTMSVARKLRNRFLGEDGIKEWLGNTDIVEDINITHTLYQAVAGMESNGTFHLKASPDGSYELSYSGTPSWPLVLRHEKHVKLILDVLDDYYSEEGGVELAKALSDHLEHD